MKNYLFISGCPRSGTSVLALILGAHNDIAMGIERYNHKVGLEFDLNTELFSKDRFFDFREEDSHIKLDQQPWIKKNYQNLETRFNECLYVGDKIPYLYLHYDKLLNEFNTHDNFKLIFIVRNIFDVANSYKVKLKQNPYWRRGVGVSIKDWNFSIRQTIQLHDKYPNFHIVEYEDLLKTDLTAINNLLNFLDLEMDESMKVELEFQLNKAERLKEERQSNYILDSDDKRKILKKAKIHLYNKLIHLHNG